MPALIRAFRESCRAQGCACTRRIWKPCMPGLESGRIDLALVYDFGVVADVEMVPLIDVPPHALVAGDHPLATRQSVDLATLLRDPLILVNLLQSRIIFSTSSSRAD
ncbi:MAG: hypothetical protein HPM95_10055 [Alphaproteobacteria bacterium]|nr:hypothetical protein [Alphaproteobacteria bacterium]